MGRMPRTKPRPWRRSEALRLRRVRKLLAFSQRPHLREPNPVGALLPPGVATDEHCLASEVSAAHLWRGQSLLVASFAEAGAASDGGGSSVKSRPLHFFAAGPRSAFAENGVPPPRPSF